MQRWCFHSRLALTAALTFLLAFAASPADAQELPTYSRDDLVGEWEGILMRTANSSWTLELTLRTTELAEPENAAEAAAVPDAQAARLERLRQRREAMARGQAVGPARTAPEAEAQPVTTTGRSARPDVRAPRAAAHAPQPDRNRDPLAPQPFYGTLRFRANMTNPADMVRPQDPREMTRGEVTLAGTLDPRTGAVEIRHGMQVIRAPQATPMGTWPFHGLFDPDEPAIFGWSEDGTGAQAPFLLRPKGSLNEEFFARFDLALTEVARYHAENGQLIAEVQRRRQELTAKHSEMKRALEEDPTGASLDLPDLPEAPVTRRGGARVRTREQTPLQRINAWQSAQSQEILAYEQAQRKELQERYQIDPQTREQRRPPLSIELDVDRITAWVQRLADQNPQLVRDDRHWMSRMEPMLQSLLADAYFEPTFGVKFDELNETDRYFLGMVVQRRGRQQFTEYVELPEPLFGHGAQPLARMFDGSAPRATVRTGGWYAYHVANGVVDRRLRRWRDTLLSTLETAEPTADAFERLQAFEVLAAKYLKHMFTNEQDEVTLAFDDARLRLADDVILLRARAALAEADAADEQLRLVQLAYFWQRQQNIAGYLTPEGRAAAEQLIQGRLDALVQAIVDEMTPRLASLGEGVAAAQGGVAWYRELVGRVGPAQQHQAVTAAIGQLAQRRAADLEAALPTFQKEVEAAPNADRIQTLLDDTLAIPGDSHTPAGQRLGQAARERLASINLAQFMARYSPAEQALMAPDQPGRIVVPRDYPPPTADEIALAYVREITNHSGERVDNHTALYGIPGLERLELFVRTSFDDVKVVATGRADEGGYGVYYTMQLSMEPAANLARMIDDDSIQSELARGLYRLAENVPVAAVDRFVLTAEGWRSPTIRSRALTGMQFEQFSEDEMRRMATDWVRRDVSEPGP